MHKLDQLGNSFYLATLSMAYVFLKLGLKSKGTQGQGYLCSN